MPKNIVSAFAYEWYPVYELRYTTPEVAFEVDARVLKRWEKTFADFKNMQEEIREAQKKSIDLRDKVKDA
jgi:hypothetical protein